MDRVKRKQDNVMRNIIHFLEQYKKTPAERRTKGFIAGRVEALQSYWTVFQSLHEERLLAADEQTMQEDYFVQDYPNRVELSYATALGELYDELENWKVKSASLSCPSALSSNSVEQVAVAPLPRITMPQFSGNYADWESFRDLFMALVHNNPQLSHVQRLHYLKTSVGGEAATLLKNISLTAANYEDAWKLLRMRYENQRMIVYTHMRNLIRQKPIVSDSATALKQLLDNTMESVRALRNLGRPVDAWDDWLTCLILENLDPNSHKDWETTMGMSSDIPKLSDLQTFLEGRIRALEAIGAKNVGKKLESSSNSNHQLKRHTTNTRAHVANTAKQTCPACDETHWLGSCPKFQSLSAQQRQALVRRTQACFNCLRRGHPAYTCSSSGKCKYCGRNHHSSLHINNSITHKDNSGTETPEGQAGNKAEDDHQPIECKASTSTAVHHARDYAIVPRSVFLATAMVIVRAPSGRTSRVRALLDPGSEASFITESVVQSLRLPTQRISREITGIGNAKTSLVNRIASLQIESCRKPIFRSDMAALVLANITSYVPPQVSGFDRWEHLRDITYADPHYTEHKRIELLIGADLYPTLLLEGLRSGRPGTPVAQQTRLGWILFGTIDGHTGKRVKNSSCSLHTCYPTLTEISETLRRFWEVEDLPATCLLTEEERTCAEHFRATHQRNTDGRYVVRLPWNPAIPRSLGESKAAALASFQRLERRFGRQPALRSPYIDFMREYEQLHHMDEIKDVHTSSGLPYYLPHHAVIKDSSSTTKLRVVFNASQPTSNGRSLNDCLLTGPKLQHDIAEVLLRWRRFAVVFTADIAKMYRQIMVHPEDRDLQRIVWKDDEHRKELAVFRLNTVTYGTASAPYLAIRTLQQLAIDERQLYPVGADILDQDTYVDDILSGGADINSATTAKSQLIALLRAGGFELRKWSTNHSALIDDIPEEHRESLQTRLLGEEGFIRTLGLVWEPSTDTFAFRINLVSARQATKRTILSEVAQLYDPVGWLAPIIIVAKILLQKLWMLGVSWDDPLPLEVGQGWLQYRESLADLDAVKIPRWVGHRPECTDYEVHGFSDASESAYAAAVYLRTFQNNRPIQVTLLTGKSKVAPLKTLSIPRLELCGATLLARLMARTIRVMGYDMNKARAWTDSTIVLTWVKNPPSRWKTFIANRVSDIQTQLPGVPWAHVRSEYNPADCASRGVSVQQLIHQSLWWQGPSWLAEDMGIPAFMADEDTLNSDVLEERSSTCGLTSIPAEPWDVLNRYSCLGKLLRVTAFCRRFISNVRHAACNRLTGPLTAEEIAASLRYWITEVQKRTFDVELKCLRSKQKIPARSPLSRLNPFVDGNLVIRVGGRLRRSPLDFGERHPIILPKGSNLTRLIVARAHETMLHGGSQLTLSHLRRRYWILNARNLVRLHIRRCVSCFRQRPQANQPLMGDLPSTRVTPSRPFLHTGVDYAGPVPVRTTKGRGHHTHKGYVALFICLATRAIHLELVSDYTAQGFLAAFRRFVARRGLCACLYSDNGTNFHGAYAELKALFQRTTKEHAEIAALLANDGIDWKFNPPSAPHFGGIWEAGVKSMKHHLIRLLKDKTMTFEELSTALAQIEACLNSRPLSAISDDPDDFAALTPGHFLIGSVLTSVPEPSTLDLNCSHLTRWLLVRNVFEHFWQRWRQEYLHTLQQRTKWRSSSVPAQVNQLVVIKDDNLPPGKWNLGRIIKVHPGADGQVRVVTLRTQRGTLTRPVTKICMLPVETREA